MQTLEKELTAPYEEQMGRMIEEHAVPTDEIFEKRYTIKSCFLININVTKHVPLKNLLILSTFLCEKRSYIPYSKKNMSLKKNF